MKKLFKALARLISNIFKHENEYRPSGKFRKAKYLITQNEVTQALEYLLEETRGSPRENDLILLKQQWTALKDDRNLGLISEKEIRTSSAKLVHGILAVIERIEKSQA